jgi:hypothetical protein
VEVLNVCGSMVALEEGKCVHQRIIQSGIAYNVFVANSLFAMYARCGSINVWRMFNKTPSQNVIIWPAMMLGHVQCGQGSKVLELF